MEENGITVQAFRTVTDAGSATAAAKDLGAPEFVIKAQVFAGGRGKGTFASGYQGGVKLTTDADEVGEIVRNMLEGGNLVTKQTPPDGVPVNTVMIAHALDIERETYFAILMDRDSNGPVLVGSPDGGVDIEEVGRRPFYPYLLCGAHVDAPVFSVSNVRAIVRPFRAVGWVLATHPPQS